MAMNFEDDLAMSILLKYGMMWVITALTGRPWKRKATAINQKVPLVSAVFAPKLASCFGSVTACF
jgi:hypothetical protein